MIITTPNVWEKAARNGKFTQSTINSTLDEIGYIHCTSPDQTMEIAQRFTDMDNLVMLLIDANKVKSPLKFEPAPSGRPGLFPHIYGPLNTDAVYATLKLVKNKQNKFITPPELINAMQIR